MSYGDYPTADWLDQFFGEVLAQLGLYATSFRLQFLETWSHFETGGGTAGTGPYFNPLGTTYKTPGAMPNIGGQQNVWLYPSIQEGALATANTIQNYPDVMQTLSNESLANRQSLAQSIAGSWGTGGFANLLLQGYTPAGPSVAVPTLGLATRPTVTPPSIPPSIAPPPNPTPSIAVASRAPVPVIAPPNIPPQIVAPYIPPTPTPQPSFQYGANQQPYPVINIQPGQGIPQSALQQGQFNVVNLNEAVPVNDLQGYTAWQFNGGRWQEYNPGETLTGQVGLLPTGMSLPGGLNAR